MSHFDATFMPHFCQIYTFNLHFIFNFHFFIFNLLLKFTFTFLSHFDATF